MNWLTRAQGIESTPIIKLTDTAVWLDVALEAKTLTHKREMAPPVRPLSEGMYHDSSESKFDMLLRWREAL